ncbi:cysteine hydrolase family protein [Pseudalkalibacillus hwajinpoensis]|uniref:cysteine hydrolase family protein n=1 Tax=Guptibacillus hwajinpoensis TaxID=208199 RepID=UPI00325AAAA4
MANSALLMIDVQNGMFQRGRAVYNDARLLYNFKKIIASAKSEQMPVFYIQHEAKHLEPNSPAWQLHPFLQVENDDEIIHKTTPDAFYNTNLEDKLRAKDIQHLYLSGIQTEVCVDTTCRCAYSKGFQTHLIQDAHSTWNSPSFSTPDIIAHHNHTLQWFTNTILTDFFVERLR